MQTFDYLGYRISFDGDDTAAIKHRIGLGWDAFNKNKLILTSKLIPYIIKSKVYKTYIVPVVLYGLECSTWKEATLQKLETFQNYVMRFMTSHTLLDKVTITTLRQATGLQPIVSCLKLKLFGHIRRSSTGLVKVCVEGMIQGKRSRGRPRRRWIDDIKSWTRLTINSLNRNAMDREVWKRTCYWATHSPNAEEA